MQLVAECLPQMAASYPREFLQLVARMPLQPAPELLGGKDTHSVMIPHMLVEGSDQRCPRDVWDPALQRFTRTQEQGSIIDELLKGAAGAAQGKFKGAGAEPKTSALDEAMPEGFCRTTRGNLQAFRPSPGAGPSLGPSPSPSPSPGPSPSPSPSPSLDPSPSPSPKDTPDANPNPNQPAGLPRAVRRLRAPGDDRAGGRCRDGHQGLQRLRLQP
jgi:hypothetical protein